MTLLIAVFFGSLNPDLTLKKSLCLSVFVGSPVFGEGGDNTFWLADRYGSWVRRYDGRGNELQLINYGSGSGPGELQKPRNILAFPEKNRLLVGCRYGTTHSFWLETGVFLKKVISFLPSSATHSWSPDSFLVIWGKNESGRDAFLVYSLVGEPIESWVVPQPSWQKEYIYDAPRGYAVGQKTVYIGYMAKPEVRIYGYRKKRLEFGRWQDLLVMPSRLMTSLGGRKCLTVTRCLLTWNLFPL